MIKLDKHTNPSLSLINSVGVIIQELKEKKIVSYEELLGILQRELSDSIKEIYPYALSFLYLLGKVEYLNNIDALRLLE